MSPDVRKRVADRNVDLTQVRDTETVHHESRSKQRRPKVGVRQLNLTSMLDVCFLLLIFFIVTANFAVNEGVLPADLPEGTPPVPQESPPPQEPLVIVLRSVGIEGCSIWVERSATIADGDFQRLFEVLNGWRYDPKANPNGQFEADNPIVIKPMPDVLWKHIVDGFNAVIRAKYTNVSFAQAG
jgi:biopolymer transport protein ExbD